MRGSVWSNGRLTDAALLALAISVGLVLALAFGGTLETGQIRLYSWWPWLAAIGVFLAAVAITLRKRPFWRLPLIGMVGLVASALLLAGLAGQRRSVPWPTGDAMRGSREELAVMSSLHPFDEKHPSPAMAVLGRTFRITMIDRIAPEALARQGRLLLIQPRLLAPRELVALDGWVREGGRLVILADPLLTRPSSLPLGDRRRPPLTSLLDPLLDHWQLALEAAPSLEGRVERRFLSDGSLLPIAGASRLVTTGPFCRTIEHGLIALCRIGRGQVRLLADADLVDERLWLVEGGDPLSHGAWTGDTMDLLAAWLRAPLSTRPIAAARHWVRDDAALWRAVRWALLAGTIWAILGSALPGRRERGKIP